jgi:dTDP-4-amino-4,6-dideoxygalactose transaminase
MPVCFENRKMRDELYSELLRSGVKSRKYFYPLTSTFEYVNTVTGSSELTIAHNIADRILCLPLYPNLEMDEVIKIIDLIKKKSIKVY